MGGDSCHHGGQLRPSQYLPFPSEISPNPFNRRSPHPCPGAIFEHLLRNGDKEKPFYIISRDENGKGLVAADTADADSTIGKLQESDAWENILVAVAHDDSFLPVVDFFPEYANEFMKRGWANAVKWTFLKDFEGAVEVPAAIKES